MSDRIVVDACVAVKWGFTEDNSDLARAMLEAGSDERGHQLIAAPLLRIEVTNAIYQRLRRNSISMDEANDALGIIADAAMSAVPSGDLPDSAFQFARMHNLPNIYDCIYVVLAHREGAEL